MADRPRHPAPSPSPLRLARRPSWLRPAAAACSRSPCPRRPSQPRASTAGALSAGEDSSRTARRGTQGQQADSSSTPSPGEVPGARRPRAARRTGCLATAGLADDDHDRVLLNSVEQLVAWKERLKVGSATSRRKERRQLADGVGRWAAVRAAPGVRGWRTCWPPEEPAGRPQPRTRGRLSSRVRPCRASRTAWRAGWSVKVGGEDGSTQEPRQPVRGWPLTSAPGAPEQRGFRPVASTSTFIPAQLVLYSLADLKSFLARPASRDRVELIANSIASLAGRTAAASSARPPGWRPPRCPSALTTTRSTRPARTRSSTRFVLFCQKAARHAA